MSIDVWVPGGDASEPGFAVQRSGSGRLSIAAGQIGADTSLFGVTNDQNGLLINTFPATPPPIVDLYGYVCLLYDHSLTLRGDFTLDRMVGGAPVENIVTEHRWTWRITPLPGTTYLDHENLLSSGTNIGGVPFEGCGYLYPETDYRITIYFYGYTGIGPDWSYKVIEVKTFTTPADPGTGAYVRCDIPVFTKHNNQTADEWT